MKDGPLAPRQPASLWFEGRVDQEASEASDQEVVNCPGAGVEIG